MQIQDAKVIPGWGGKARSPSPIPPMTELSCDAKVETPTTEKLKLTFKKTQYFVFCQMTHLIILASETFET